MAQQIVTPERRSLLRRAHDIELLEPDGGLDRVVLLRVLSAVRDGDFSVRLPLDWEGIDGKIADTVNDIVTSEDKLARAFEQAASVVGIEGQLSHRVALERTSGSWTVKVNSINS